jgi:hypothetical protein
VNRHHYPFGVPWQWPAGNTETLPSDSLDTVPFDLLAVTGRPKPPRKPSGRALVALGATCIAAACLAAMQGCEWPENDAGGPPEGAGILVSSKRAGQYRTCVYSDGFVLTVGSLEVCPLTD